MAGIGGGGGSGLFDVATTHTLTISVSTGTAASRARTVSRSRVHTAQAHFATKRQRTIGKYGHSTLTTLASKSRTISLIRHGSLTSVASHLAGKAFHLVKTVLASSTASHAISRGRTLVRSVSVVTAASRNTSIAKTIQKGIASATSRKRTISLHRSAVSSSAATRGHGLGNAYTGLASLMCHPTRMMTISKTVNAGISTGASLQKSIAKVAHVAVVHFAAVFSPSFPPSVINTDNPFAGLAQWWQRQRLMKGLKLVISPAKLIAFLDQISLMFRTADSQAAADAVAAAAPLAYGNGTDQTGTGDDTFIAAIIPALESAENNVTPDEENANRSNGIFQTVNGILAKEGPLSGQALVGTSTTWSSLVTYLRYQQQQTLYSALVSPATAYQSWLRNGGGYDRGTIQSLLMLLDPTNVFAPPTTFGHVVVPAGTFTPGSTIPTTNNTAAIDLINGNQGFTPAPGVNAVITTQLNGTCSITITGNGWGADGVAFMGHTWTVNLSGSYAIGDSIAFTPATAGDRISAVTAVAVTGTPTTTVGAFDLESQLERVITGVQYPSGGSTSTTSSNGNGPGNDPGNGPDNG